jgi:hypothetical protein
LIGLHVGRLSQINVADSSAAIRPVLMAAIRAGPGQDSLPANVADLAHCAMQWTAAPVAERRSVAQQGKWPKNWPNHARRPFPTTAVLGQDRLLRRGVPSRSGRL